jgi:hypothetical protein
VSVLGICDSELVELFGFAARTSEGAVVSWEKEGGDNAVDSKLLALAVMDHAADAMRTDLMTITRHVLNEQSKFPEARGDLTILLNNIVLGCKFVCSSVSKVSQLCFVLTHQDMSVISLHCWNWCVILYSARSYCFSSLPSQPSIVPYEHGLLHWLNHWFHRVKTSGALSFYAWDSHQSLMPWLNP